jgi:hypothetical protein
MTKENPKWIPLPWTQASPAEVYGSANQTQKLLLSVAGASYAG